MSSQFAKSVRDAKRRNSDAGKASGRQVSAYAGQSSSLNPFSQRDQISQMEEQLNHNIGYVYSICKTIGNTIAGQAIHVGRVTDDIEQISQASHRSESYRVKSLMPKAIRETLRIKSAQHFTESVEVLTEHPLLNALQQPNAMMGKFPLIANTFVCLETCGVMYWWFQFPGKDNGLKNPQIYPLPPSWVTPLHSDKKLFAAFQIRPTGFSSPFVVPANEMGVFYYPDPANPMMPLSPLQALSRTVKIDENVEECQLRHFTNGHKAGLAIIVGKMPGVEGVSGPTNDAPILTIEQRAQLISAVNKGWQGSINHNNPIILDGFIKDVKKITESVSEMDYPNSGVMAKQRLAEGWGISPLILGQMQNANRAGATVAKEHYYDIVINPRIAMFSEALTHHIAPLFEDSEDVVVWLENMIAIDQEFDLALDIAMVDRGAKSKNEWRQKHNLPPIDGGDEYESRGSGSGGQNNQDTEDDEDEAESDDEDDPKDKPKEKPKKKAKHPSWHDKLGLAGHIRVIGKRADAMEAELKHSLKTFFIQMGEKVGAILRHHLLGQNAYVSDGLADILIHDSEWKGEFLFVIKPILLKTALASATIEWNMHKERAKSKVKGFFSDLVALPKILADTVAFKVGEWLDSFPITKIFDSVRNAVNAAIGVIKETFTGAQLVDKVISQVFGDTGSNERAEIIASTEAAAAINIGTYTTVTYLGSLGILNARRWCTREDDCVRATHIEANGQVVGLADKFTVGGFECQYPGDPSLPIQERIRCRCFMVGVKR